MAITMVNWSVWLLKAIQVKLGRTKQSLLSFFFFFVLSFLTVCFVIQCFCLETRKFNCSFNTPDDNFGVKLNPYIDRTLNGILALYCGITTARPN
jgi:hypothetical protein